MPTLSRISVSEYEGERRKHGGYAETNTRHGAIEEMYCPDRKLFVCRIIIRVGSSGNKVKHPV